jgi:hypothetical protein
MTDTGESRFIDYDGPTGLFVALEDHMAPLESPEALEGLAHSAMLVSLGRTPEAARFQATLRESNSDEAAAADSD